MSRHHNIVIVCDHGRKGDGRIEHERCDLVAPIIWVDETQGWLPQAPAVATLLDDDNQPRAVIGLPPNESRLRPEMRRDGWVRLHWEFACLRYGAAGVRTCEQRPVRVRNGDLQTLCENVPRLLTGLAGNPDTHRVLRCSRTRWSSPCGCGARSAKATRRTNYAPPQRVVAARLRRSRLRLRGFGVPKESHVSTIYHHRGRVAALSRSRASDDPEFIAAKTDLVAANIADYLIRTLAAAPPLTDEQRTRLAELLRPVRRSGGAR